MEQEIQNVEKVPNFRHIRRQKREEMTIFVAKIP